MNDRTNVLFSFAFGFITVGICTKITSLVYSKGVENSFLMSGMFNINSVKKDSRHPMVICKVIGETINRSLSKTLDFIAFIPSIIAVVTKAAGMNVFGVDQKGEITYDLSADNSYTSVLLIGYGFFFTLLFSFWGGSPET